MTEIELRARQHGKTAERRASLINQLMEQIRLMDNGSLAYFLSIAEVQMKTTDSDYEAMNAERSDIERRDTAAARISQLWKQQEIDVNKLLDTRATLLKELERATNNPLMSFDLKAITDPIMKTHIEDMRDSQRLIYELLKTFIPP